MRIVMVTTRFPLPVYNGDSAIVVHRIEHLADEHEVTLVSFYDKRPPKQQIAQMKQRCHRLVLIPFRRLSSFVSASLRGLFSTKPLQVLLYSSPFHRRQLRRVLGSDEFDVADFFLVRTAEHMTSTNCVKVLDLVDAFSVSMKRRADSESNPIRRLFWREEHRRLCGYERRAIRRSDKALLVSDKDAASIPAKQIAVLPLGVDSEEFAPTGNKSPTPTIIFHGNMGYEPNVTAVRWFANHCLPLLADLHFEFRIVGHRPTAEVLALANHPKVTVVGSVPSVSDELKRAWISVAPMQTGAGMQNKVLEAMSTGLPVVTTTIGRGAIKAEPGREIAVEDALGSFAERCRELLRSEENRRLIGQNARSAILEAYSWGGHTQRHLDLVGDAIGVCDDNVG